MYAFRVLCAGKKGTLKAAHTAGAALSLILISFYLFLRIGDVLVSFFLHNLRSLLFLVLSRDSSHTKEKITTVFYAFLCEEGILVSFLRMLFAKKRYQYPLFYEYKPRRLRRLCRKKDTSTYLFLVLRRRDTKLRKTVSFCMLNKASKRKELVFVCEAFSVPSFPLKSSILKA